jgi:hypothetical protein
MLALIVLSSFLWSNPPKVDSSYKTQLELRGYFSTQGRTPLWQRSLHYGQVPLESNTAVTIIKHEKTDNLKKDLAWKYTVEATAWGGKSTNFDLTKKRGLRCGRYNKHKRILCLVGQCCTHSENTIWYERLHKPI